MEAIIGSNETKISLANLSEFPLFLRFSNVRLHYSSGSQLLFAKCRLFEDCLSSIKAALKDSNNIYFEANINPSQVQSEFSDHSSLVIYLRDRLLPICDSSRRYEFNIDFDFDEYEPDDSNPDSAEHKPDDSTDLVRSILQISQVRNCSNVSIYLFCMLHLPVDDISNWLVPKAVEGAEICGKKEEQNRFLLINTLHVPNSQEMWDHFKEVNLILGLDFG